MASAPVYVGVADHAGWAVLVTVGADATVLDRRRVELVDAALPSLPHHHECQALPPAEAEALVGRVAASAAAHAQAGLAALAAELPAPVAAITLRACPPLPATVAERIADYRAQCVADTVMYRSALADAASAMGWEVSWYESRRVIEHAAAVLGRDAIDDLLAAPRTALGPPWRKDHRIAMAAAIAAQAV